MVSTKTLLKYPDWKLPFTFNTDTYDKQLGAIISNNKQRNAFFSIRLRKPQRNCTTNEK